MTLVTRRLKKVQNYEKYNVLTENRPVFWTEITYTFFHISGHSASSKNSSTQKYSLKPGELFEVPSDDKTTECRLCFDVAKPFDGIDLGPLYQYGKPIEGSNDVKIYWYVHINT